MKRVACLLILLLNLVLPASAQEGTAISVEQVQQLLLQYDNASYTQKLQIGNQLLAQYEELADTLYHFEAKDKVTEDFLDFQVWYWSGEYAYDNDQFQVCLDMARHALAGNRQDILDQDLAACLNLAAIACHRMADYAQSIVYAQECLEVSRRTNSDEDISMTLNTLAAIYVAAGTPAQGIPYILEAIEIDRRINNPALSIHLGTASDTYLGMGEAQKALPYAQEALDAEIETSGPDAPKVAIRKSQLAAVYSNLKDYAHAEPLLIEACDAFRTQGRLHSLSVTLGQLGHLYLQTNRKLKALDPLKEAVSLCQQLGNIYNEAKNHNLLSQALVDIQPRQAYEELLSCSQLRDSIYKEQTAAKLQEFDAKYEASEKQHQLDLKEEYIKRTHLILGAVVIIAIIALVLLVIAFRLASVRKRANQALIKASRAKDELLVLAKQETEDLRRRQLLQVAQNLEQMGDLPDVSLTSREKQIVALYAQGLLSKEIASQLGISIRTVETHKVHIYRKLGINNNIELLRYAQANGLAPI